MTAFQICDDEYVLGTRTAPEIFLTNVLKPECGISHHFMTDLKIPHIFLPPSHVSFFTSFWQINVKGVSVVTVGKQVLTKHHPSMEHRVPVRSLGCRSSPG